MTYFGLKIFACITMLADHLSLVYPIYFDWLDMLCGAGYRVPFFRLIGRLAFPVFAFLIVNGLKHTRDVRRYACRLLLLAVLSEVPYNFMVRGKWIHFGSVNVVFTLLIGLVCLALCRIFKEKYRFWRFISAACLVMGCVAAICLGSDYSYIGVLMVFVFGIFDLKKTREKALLTILLAVILCWKSVCGFVGMWLSGLCGLDVLALPLVGKLFVGDIWPLWVRLFSLVSLFFIFSYRQEKGLAFIKPAASRAVGYILNGFYPVHMLLIYWFYIR